MLLHQHAHRGPGRPQAAGDPQGEGAVGLGQEAHVPEGAVDAVVHPVAEGDFQLAGHLDVPADGQQIFGHRLGVGNHVEGLAGLDAAEGAGHHVPGVVAAAPLGVYLTAHRLGHEGRHLIGRQVVELDGLAGGQLHPAHLLPLHHLGQELQPLHRQPSAGQTQAEHVFGGVPLGVGAQAAGHALVVLPVDLPLVEGADGVFEALNFCVENIGPLFVHMVCQPFPHCDL